MTGESATSQIMLLAASIADGTAVAKWASSNDVPERTVYRWAAKPDVRSEIESIRRRAPDETCLAGSRSCGLPRGDYRARPRPGRRNGPPGGTKDGGENVRNCKGTQILEKIGRRNSLSSDDIKRESVFAKRPNDQQRMARIRGTPGGR